MFGDVTPQAVLHFSTIYTQNTPVVESLAEGVTMELSQKTIKESANRKAINPVFLCQENNVSSSTEVKCYVWRKSICFDEKMGHIWE